MISILLTSCSPQSEKGYIPVKDGKVFYQSFGSGEPILVLHGGPGLDQTYFLPQMLELAKEHRVIFYDQRGSGNSLQTPLDVSHINIEQFTEDVEAVRKELGLEHFVLMGHSWGGLLAMNYAAKYPDHLTKLILLTPAPATHAGQQGFMDAFTIRTESIAAELGPLSSEDAFQKMDASEIEAFYRKLFRFYFYDPNKVDSLTLTFDVTSARSGFKVKSLLLQDCWLKEPCTLISKLHLIKVPTLMIFGDVDLIPLSSGKEMKEAISGSEMLVIKNCGHYPYIEKPNELFGAIRSFLERDEQFLFQQQV